MGRIIVVVLILCSALLFLLAMQTPPQMIRSSYIYQRYFKPTETPEPLATEPVAAKKAPQRALAMTTRSVQVMAPTKPPAAEPIVEAASAVAPAQVPAQLPKGVRSTSNDAVVYSSNSPSATVLQVLNKGEIVEVELEVSTGTGKWTLVRIPGQNYSGFVRSDGLVVTRTADPPTAVEQPARQPQLAQ